MESLPIDMQASVILKKDSDLLKHKWSLPEQGSSMRFNSIINFARTKPNINHCVMCGDSKVPIPSQNKGVCKTCDSSFWYSHNFDVVFKFCKGCKVFCVLQGFHDKPEASKCLKCRQRGSQSYFMKKSELHNSKFRPEASSDQERADSDSPEELSGRKRKTVLKNEKCHRKVCTPCPAQYSLMNVAEVTPMVVLDSTSHGQLNRSMPNSSAYSSTIITPDGLSFNMPSNQTSSIAENKENVTPSGCNFATHENSYSDSPFVSLSHGSILPKWWDPENPLMNLARLTTEHFQTWKQYITFTSCFYYQKWIFVQTIVDISVSFPALLHIQSYTEMQISDNKFF